jgi:predicted DCC family thiol-disulfide oxidoreductase YuxK
VITEITKTTDFEPACGWVFYDGMCVLCRRLARRFQSTLAAQGFRLAALQEPWVNERLRLPDSELLAEMRLLTADGRVFGGAEAVIELARRIWWGWPLYACAKVPAVRRGLHRFYRSVAQRRHCRAGACAMPERNHWPAWAPLLVAPLLAMMLRNHLPPWAFMWTLAGTVFAACKWMTWWEGRQLTAAPNTKRSLGYLFAWPGMDAREFLCGATPVAKPKGRAWSLALGKTLMGAVLIWGVVRLIPGDYPFLTGWTGLVGLVFLLHFGLFHLLALAWQAAGVNAQPIMNMPIRATSLSEFWSRRWNAAFNHLVYDAIFCRTRRGVGVAGATLLVFLISGLIHEAVISYPARGGYGLPTAYFLLQGAGLLLERTRLGRRIGLGHGWRGWAFTLVFTAGPAFWLFHPPFVNNVIRPFLQVIGAS